MAENREGRDHYVSRRLRNLAEEHIARGEITPPPTDDPRDRVVQELQIHQVELEIQNEELRSTQVEMQRIRDEYARLYEYAPVGLIILSREGQVIRYNKMALHLLSQDYLAGEQVFFTRFLSEAGRQVFNSRFRSFFERPQERPMDVITADQRYLRLAGAPGVEHAVASILVAVTDVTEERHLHRKLKEAEAELRDLREKPTR